MSLIKHAAFLVAVLVLSGHAQAQFKGVAEPMPAVPTAPTAVAPPVMAPNLGAATAPITSTPTIAAEVDAAAAARAAAPETTGRSRLPTRPRWPLDAPTGRTARPSPRARGHSARRSRKC